MKINCLNSKIYNLQYAKNFIFKTKENEIYVDLLLISIEILI
ncbi:hypothetical protein [Metamycoplasma hominis]|nr:hypothetical protein [Metamycoplasma hominis]